MYGVEGQHHKAILHQALGKALVDRAGFALLRMPAGGDNAGNLGLLGRLRHIKQGADKKSGTAFEEQLLQAIAFAVQAAAALQAERLLVFGQSGKGLGYRLGDLVLVSSGLGGICERGEPLAACLPVFSQLLDIVVQHHVLIGG